MYEAKACATVRTFACTVPCLRDCCIVPLYILYAHEIVLMTGGFLVQMRASQNST